jgi:DNA-directed RNA polymerase specialized sigma24 family protein
MDPQEEIVRLLAIQLRMQLETQADAIRELGKAGFGPSRIAELLGTTPGTVNVALVRAKENAAKKRRTTKKTSPDRGGEE